MVGISLIIEIWNPTHGTILMTISRAWLVIAA